MKNQNQEAAARPPMTDETFDEGRAEHAALVAVAEAAQKAREVLVRARCGDCGLKHIQNAADCELEIDTALAALAAIRGGGK